MKHFFLPLFLLLYCCFAYPQEIVKPYAPINDSIPNFVDFVEKNNLMTMHNDTVTLNIVYIKRPYWRPDETWGVINSDMYATYTDIVYVGKEELSKTLLCYFRDYKNKKPTRFCLMNEQEKEEIIKQSYNDGDDYYFFRPEKFVIKVNNVDGIDRVTLKRVHIPQHIKIEIE